MWYCSLPYYIEVYDIGYGFEDLWNERDDEGRRSASRNLESNFRLRRLTLKRPDWNGVIVIAQSELEARLWEIGMRV